MNYLLDGRRFAIGKQMKFALQKARSYWVRWSPVLSCIFGQVLPTLLASLLFITLGYHIFSEISGMKCKTVEINHEEYLLAVECERGSFVETISSNSTHNLSLLLAASIGWLFFYLRAKTADLNARASEQSAEATRKNAETAEKGLTTERLTRAIEQLTNDKVSVRLGGILGLEQIASSHEEERKKIIQILSARIHELAPLDDDTKHEDWRRRLDIKSVMEVLAKIAKPLGNEKKSFCILDNVNLSWLSFEEMDLSYFSLINTDISGSKFKKIDFSYTKFFSSIIEDTTFENYEGLTKEQIMTANWNEGRAPSGLPEEWQLPEENIIKDLSIKQESRLLAKKYGKQIQIKRQ